MTIRASLYVGRRGRDGPPREAASWGGVPEAQEDTGTIFYWSTNAISIIQNAKNRTGLDRRQQRAPARFPHG